jgi:7-cyano-7-deazaguanine synthase in queuosine biosynthesis
MIAIVLSSGGLRSLATLLMALRQHGPQEVLVLHIDYGQRLAMQESTASLYQAQRLQVKRETGTTRLQGLCLSSRMSGHVVAGEGLQHPLLAPRITASASKSGALGKWLQGPHGPRIPSAHFLPGLAQLLVGAGGMLAVREGAAEVWLGLGWPGAGIEALQEATRWATQAPDLRLSAPLAGQPLQRAYEVALQHGQLEMARGAVGCHAGASSMWRAWGSGCGECPGCKARGDAWEVFARQHLPPEEPAVQEDPEQAKELEEKRVLGQQKLDEGGW